MTNNRLAAELVKLMGGGPEQNEILKTAIIDLLQEDDPKEERPATDEKKKTAAEKKPAAAQKQQTKAKPEKKEYDWGKAEACRRAGWSVAKIADELGCSVQTVYNHFKEKEKGGETR